MINQNFNSAYQQWLRKDSQFGGNNKFQRANKNGQPKKLETL